MLFHILQTRDHIYSTCSQMLQVFENVNLNSIVSYNDVCKHFIHDEYIEHK